MYVIAMSEPNDPFRAQLIEVLPRLRRFGRSLARQPGDADDLVQMALERALVRKDQWHPDLPLAGWLFGIMKNAWIDEVRSRKRQAKVFAGEEAGAHVGEAFVEAAMEVASVESAMDQLPDEQRLAVALVLVEGLSYKEAAHVLDIPMGTLTSRIARGREALQRLLSSPAGRRNS
jgi:RNA polymerase sigma-70 factor, ECF subfamily